MPANRKGERQAESRLVGKDERGWMETELRMGMHRKGGIDMNDSREGLFVDAVAAETGGAFCDAGAFP
jgi:hypothetical protein